MALVPQPSLRLVVAELSTEGRLPSGSEELVREKVETWLRLSDAPSPWFVRALIGLGAWVASVLFVVFLGLIDVLRRPSGALAAACAFVLAALFLRRRAIGPFGVQLALALSLGGEVLLAMGVGQRGGSELWQAALALVLLELLYLGFYRDIIRRFLSTVVALVALLALCMDQKVPHAYAGLTLVYALGASYLWLDQAALAAGRLGKAQAPIALGVLVVVLGMLASSLGTHTVHTDATMRGMTATGWPLTVALTAGLLAMEVQIAGEHGLGWQQPKILLGLLGTVLLGALSLGTPGIVAALGALLLGFHRRSTTLLVLAVVFLLIFMSGFYYNLGMTLLAKSGMLCLGGLVMLAGYAVVARQPQLPRPAVAPPGGTEGA